MVRLQNSLLLAFSYAIYYWLDARMLWLLVFATLLAWLLGREIERLVKLRKERLASWLTTAGVCVAVCLLLIFKYLNFFASEFALALRFLGFNASWTMIHLILPIGLSFYTFKLISYLVEVHREHIAAERDVVTFAAYVAFFPTILAGPIDRPQHFLPQLHRSRCLSWENLVAGGKMLLWGAFMKVCVADPLAVVTDFAWAADGSGARLSLWTFLMFPVQMYADFSGYSLMAIGVGRMIGFEVAANFRQPFLARNVAEYWRRWHISLTQWITDYVFMPLNIRWRDYGKAGLMAAVTVNLVVIGLWHGANWTYLLFGLYHAFLFLPLILSGTFGRRKKLKVSQWGLPPAGDVARMMLTYLLVAVAFVMFRAPDVAAAFAFLGNLFAPILPALPVVSGSRVFYLLLIGAVFVWEYVQRDETSPLHIKGYGALRYRAVRWLFYYVLILLLYAHSDGAGAEFIYTQF